MISIFKQRQMLLLLAMAVSAGIHAGCGGSPQFQPNRLYAKRLELEIGQQLSDQELSDVNSSLGELFGTADQPVLAETVQVVDLDRVSQAAGRVYSDQSDKHFGLYRNNCIRCHGTSGDGRGPAARTLSPYPRDFRLGKFKLKSTPQGQKPTKQDIVRTIRNGIPGTSMPSFSLLSEGDIESLAEYVIYLSVRGETERDLLSQVAFSLDYTRGDRLIDFGLKDRNAAAFDEALTRISKVANDHYAAWQDSGRQVIAPQLPSEFPVLAADPSSGAVLTPEQREAVNQSIDRGDTLFHSELASCAKCHAADGSGKNALKDFDAWTKDWSTAIGINPEDRQEIRPLMKAGALRPVPMQPRDLRLGVFRGGSSPHDIFARIVNGIEGTSMPAAAMQPAVAEGLTTNQIWDLVNYVISLSQNGTQLKQFSAQSGGGI